VAATFFYFVPGMPDSPHGTHTHNLADSLATAALITLLYGAMVRVVILRRPQAAVAGDVLRYQAAACPEQGRRVRRSLGGRLTDAGAGLFGVRRLSHSNRRCNGE